MNNELKEIINKHIAQEIPAIIPWEDRAPKKEDLVTWVFTNCISLNSFTLSRFTRVTAINDCVCVENLRYEQGDKVKSFLVESNLKEQDLNMLYGILIYLYSYFRDTQESVTFRREEFIK